MSLARLIAITLPLMLAGCGSADHVKETRATTAAASVKQASTPAAITPAKITAKKGPALVAIPAGSGHLAAMATPRGLTLRDRPGGRVIAHLKPTTEWGSPTIVWAAERRGRWLGVVNTRLRNNQVAWLDVQRDRPRMWRAPYSLHVDLSAHTMVLRRGAEVVRRMTVGIGAPSTPTPVGRFSVTDKLVPEKGVSYYGCCLLALSGHQPHLRPGWAGGDRIAIHGGTAGAASAGCLHASEPDLKRLMKVLPIGTPVYIRA
jgi:hypothetical protein